jgi:hypothetical protein
MIYVAGSGYVTCGVVREMSAAICSPKKVLSGFGIGVIIVPIAGMYRTFHVAFQSVFYIKEKRL